MTLNTNQLNQLQQEPSTQHISLDRPVRSILYFFWWFVVMLLFFTFVWSLIQTYADPWVLQLLETGDWLFVMFGAQQLLTLLVLFYAIFQWWVDSVDHITDYLEERFQRKWFRPFFIRVVGWFVFYILFNAFFFSLLQGYWIEIPWFYGEQDVMTLISGMGMTTWFERMLTALMVVFLGPIVEELVYRGLITDVLMRKWSGRWVLLWAFLFALIHMEFAVIWNLFILATILWVIYRKTESMRYSLLFHVIINWMGLFALWVDQFYDLSSLWI